MNVARYEVRGPHGDRRNPYRWHVWDRRTESPAARYSTREDARAVAAAENKRERDRAVRD